MPVRRVAWYLTVALAAMEIIYRFNTRTFYVEELVAVSGALSFFWSCLRPVYDILTWKKYVRRWSKKSIIICVQEQVFDYVIWFLTCLTVSIFVGVIIMASNE